MPPPRPALVRIAAPAEVDTTNLVIAITSTLRSRGVRVGALEVRSTVDGASALVLTTGSGARFTLPATADLDLVRARAATFDPALALLLVERGEWPTGATGSLPTIEVVPPGAQPAASTPTLLASRTVEQLGGPADDLGLAAIIEARVLGTVAGVPGPGRLARAAEAPIESERRLLERPEQPSRPPQVTGWRRWLRR